MQLEKLPIKELKEKYKELYGDTALPQNNKVYLFRRIAYKIQEQAYGGVSEFTKGRVKELILEQDPLNNLGKKKQRVADNQIAPSSRDRRLPLPGTVITKHYKDIVLQVKVLEKGFEYNGKSYRTLSRIACEVTGAHLSGFAFFGL
jgi:hypothetical protein